MGLFNRASRHSGGNGGGHGPATAGRESTHDADLGAELAELGELVPEREPEAEAATDVVEELEAAEESGSAEVEGPSAVPGTDAAEAKDRARGLAPTPPRLPSPARRRGA